MHECVHPPNRTFHSVPQLWISGLTPWEAPLRWLAKNMTIYFNHKTTVSDWVWSPNLTNIHPSQFGRAHTHAPRIPVSFSGAQYICNANLSLSLTPLVQFYTTLLFVILYCSICLFLFSGEPFTPWMKGLVHACLPPKRKWCFHCLSCFRQKAKKWNAEQSSTNKQGSLPTLFKVWQVMKPREKSDYT